MKWTSLSSAQYERLCDCRSRKEDIFAIARAYKIEKNYDAVTALEVALEHLDANGQFFDLTQEEWTDLVQDLS